MFFSITLYHQHSVYSAAHSRQSFFCLALSYTYKGHKESRARFLHIHILNGIATLTNKLGEA